MCSVMRASKCIKFYLNCILKGIDTAFKLRIVSDNGKTVCILHLISRLKDGTLL